MVYTGWNPVNDSNFCWYRWFIFYIVFTFLSAIVCIIVKRGVLVECYNLKNLLRSPLNSFESCRRLKMFNSTSENKEKHAIFYVCLNCRCDHILDLFILTIMKAIIFPPKIILFSVNSLTEKKKLLGLLDFFTNGLIS